MLRRLRTLFQRPEPLPEPQFDLDVAQRLAAAGKDPELLASRAAEPLEIPPKPALPGFTGRIELTFTLDSEGHVKAVQMTGAPFARVGELEAWAHAWRFRPAVLEGRGHPCRMVFEVSW